MGCHRFSLQHVTDGIDRDGNPLTSGPLSAFTNAAARDILEGKRRQNIMAEYIYILYTEGMDLLTCPGGRLTRLGQCGYSLNKQSITLGIVFFFVTTSPPAIIA